MKLSVASALFAWTTLASPAPKPPSFPIQWVSTIDTQNQVWYDAPGKRVALISNASQYQVAVEDYQKQRVYYMDYNKDKTERFCKFWCDISYPNVYEDLFSLNTAEYNASAKYLESGVALGQEVDVFTWNEPVKFPIDKLWMFAVKGQVPGVPVAEVRQVKGQNITYEYTDWTPLSTVPDAPFSLGETTMCDNQQGPGPQCGRASASFDIFGRKEK